MTKDFIPLLVQGYTNNAFQKISPDIPWMFQEHRRLGVDGAAFI
jgi:hypothetical protein